MVIQLQTAVGVVYPSPVQLKLGDLDREDGEIKIRVADAIIALNHIVGITPIVDCGPPLG